MILSAIKKAVTDIWDEMLYLVIFNIIWVIGTVPGLLLINYAVTQAFVLLGLVGVVLLLPWPFVTFGLFFIAYDIGQGKSIGFRTFFVHAGRTWRLAYIWGGINLGVLLVLWVNLNFYAGFRTQWAVIVQLLIVTLIVCWEILQLVLLPIYPRLEEPGFKLAFRNAAVAMGRYPLVIFVLIILVVGVGVISVYIPAVAFLVTFALIAILANRMVEAIISSEQKRLDEADD